jgi:2-polyprenyl-6-methoxyphenol hydroxylase-like FAD-dependent oxidoreductase
METSNDRQILIVGAGPTGPVAAIEVARRGVLCRIIDRLPMRSQNKIEGAKRLRQSRTIAAPKRTNFSATNSLELAITARRRAVT